MKNNVLSELNRASSEMIQLGRRRGETRHARSSRAFGQTASERIANDQPEEICHSLKSWSTRSIHVWRLRQETTHWTNERMAKRGLFIFIQCWESVWRRSGGRRGRVKPSITSRWLFEDICQVKPEDVREECAQGMSRWSLANGFEEWSDSEHRLESPPFRQSQPWRNVILLPRKRRSVLLLSSASEWDNANAWPIQSSMPEFGEQDKGEESSWPIGAERGTIEMDRWSVLWTAMKNKDWILFDPLNSIETRNRCWKVWMNEWMLLLIVEVTSPLYSSSVENLCLSNVKTWRSAVWQTELLPKDRSNDEKEDRRLRSTSSRRTIAPFIEEELNSFFWTLTTNKQFNCHESLKYQFDWLKEKFLFDSIDTFRLNISLNEWIRPMRRSRGNLSSIHSSAQNEKERSFPSTKSTKWLPSSRKMNSVSAASTESFFARCVKINGSLRGMLSSVRSPT